MREIWLRTNHRAIWFGCILPALVVLGAVWIFYSARTSPLWQALAVGLLVFGLSLIVLLLLQLRRPRIAYERGHVLFYLRAPVAVPVDVVEAFFVGQGDAHLPRPAPRQKTANLVARLAQRQTEWAQRPVQPSIGSWCDGYVTIRGTWCEPIGPDLVRRLNRRLKEVKQRIGEGND